MLALQRAIESWVHFLHIGMSKPFFPTAYFFNICLENMEGASRLSPGGKVMVLNQSTGSKSRYRNAFRRKKKPPPAVAGSGSTR